MEERKYKAQEVAYEVGVSVQTLDMWYRFKKENPDHEFSLMLPEFSRGKRSTRLWDGKDIESIKNFHSSLPQGRGGVLGSVSQRYVSKKGSRVQSQIQRILEKNNVDSNTINTVLEILNKAY